jgi:uncharacterized membrane-anchored protein YhcB (DUF1043 family)
MELLSTAINAVVVGVVGLVLARLGKGRFEAVDRRFEALEGRIDRLEERLEARMDSFQGSLDALRSDLTQVALAVGVRGRVTNA